MTHPGLSVFAYSCGVYLKCALLPVLTFERKDHQPSNASIGTVSRKNVLCHQCRRRLPDLYVHGLPVCHESVPATGETLFAISDGSGTTSCIWLCPPGGIALRRVHAPHRGEPRDDHWFAPQRFELLWVC